MTKNISGGANVPEMTDPVTTKTEFDGQAFTWMPGQRRAFADDGVAAGHAGNELDSRGDCKVDHHTSGLIYPAADGYA